MARTDVPVRPSPGARAPARRLRSARRSGRNRRRRESRNQAAAIAAALVVDRREEIRSVLAPRGRSGGRRTVWRGRDLHCALRLTLRRRSGWRRGCRAVIHERTRRRPDRGSHRIDRGPHELWCDRSRAQGLLRARRNLRCGARARRDGLGARRRRWREQCGGAVALRRCRRRLRARWRRARDERGDDDDAVQQASGMRHGLTVGLGGVKEWYSAFAKVGDAVVVAVALR